MKWELKVYIEFNHVCIHESYCIKITFGWVRDQNKKIGCLGHQLFLINCVLHNQCVLIFVWNLGNMISHTILLSALDWDHFGQPTKRWEELLGFCLPWKLRLSILSPLSKLRKHGELLALRFNIYKPCKTNPTAIHPLICLFFHFKSILKKN